MGLLAGLRAEPCPSPMALATGAESAYHAPMNRPSDFKDLSA